MSADDDTGNDEIAFGPEVAPGEYLGIRRTPGGEMREVLCRKLRDGVPLGPNSEVAIAAPEAKDGWRKLTTLYKTGPAQVATPKYREGYDRIFGKKQKVAEA